MKEWSNLPNAKHIDWVLQSLKDNPDEWAAAYYAALAAAYNAAWASAHDAAYNAAYNAAKGAAHDAAYNAAYNAATDEAWHEAKKAARDAVYGAARYAAWGAILALIAYDDSAKYLSLDYAELKAIVDITQHPAAVLLLPAAKARELIDNKAAPVVKAPLDGKTVEIDGVKYRLTPV